MSWNISAAGHVVKEAEMDVDRFINEVTGLFQAWGTRLGISSFAVSHVKAEGEALEKGMDDIVTPSNTVPLVKTEAEGGPASSSPASDSAPQGEKAAVEGQPPGSTTQGLTPSDPSGAVTN